MSLLKCSDCPLHPQIFFNTGKTVSLWLCTTRAVSFACGCTELVGCYHPGSLSTRSRESWKIRHLHNLERRNWELLLRETGIPPFTPFIFDSVHVWVLGNAHSFCSPCPYANNNKLVKSRLFMWSQTFLWFLRKRNVTCQCTRLL